MATLGSCFARAAFGSDVDSAEEVLCDGAELLCGCAHGGVSPLTVGVSAGGSCIASEGLTWPFRVLFLPAIVSAWCSWVLRMI
jgi:hypothetical protein